MLLASLLFCNGAISQIQEDSDASTSLIAQFHQEIKVLHSDMSKAFSDVKLEFEITRVADTYYDAPDKVVVWVEHGKFKVEHLQHVDGEIKQYDDSFDGKKFYAGSQDEKEVLQPAVIRIHDPFSNTNVRSGKFYLINSHDFLSYAGVHVPENGAYMRHFPYFGSRLEHLLKKGESVSVYESDGNIIVKCVVPDYFMQYINEDREYYEKRGWSSASPINDRKAAPKRKIEMHMDPDYRFAPVYMIENHRDGRRTTEVRAKDWKHYKEYDIWIPSNLVIDSVYESDMSSYIYSLKNLEFRCEDNVNYNLLEEYDKPATWVLDFTHPDAKDTPGGEARFYVGADGELTKKYQEAIIAEIKRSKKNRLLLLASIVILLGSIVYIWKRRNNKYGK